MLDRTANLLAGMVKVILAGTALFGAACSSSVVVRDPDFFLVRAARGDTAKSIAARHLGDPELAWLVAELNEDIREGGLVLTPRRDVRPTGVTPTGIHVVPILAYHQLSASGNCPLLTVCSDKFKDQITYLSENGYHVASLEEFTHALKQGRRLAPNSVVITLDDGWGSTFDIAYPTLAEAGMPGTVFVYTDFVGSKAALDWGEARLLVRSGVVDVQSHSTSHANLVLKNAPHNRSAVLKKETALSRKVLSEKLRRDIYAFAYPYGAADGQVVESVREAGYEIGLTVTRGANPLYAYPFLLKRTMLYGADTLPTFRKRLNSFYRRDLQ